MGFTTKKYRVSVSFATNWHFLVELKTNTIGFFLKLIKTYIQDYYV
jgi:hypothetical protein